MLKLSICLAVYNVEQYLPAMLDSCIGQTYSNLEILVVDDGSTDRSGAIADDYAKRDPRVRVIHQANQGLLPVRVVCLQNATGDYICLADGDDYFALDWAEKCVAILTEHPVEMVMWNYYTASKTQSTPHCCPYQGLYAGNDYQAIIHDAVNRIKYCCCFWVRLLRRDVGQKMLSEVYQKLELLTPPLISYSEDQAVTFCTDFLIQSVYVCPDPLYYYRRRQSSIVHQKMAENYQSLALTGQKIQKFLEINQIDFDFYNYFAPYIWVAFGRQVSCKNFRLLNRNQYFQKVFAGGGYQPKTFKAKLKKFLYRHNMAACAVVLTKMHHKKDQFFD